MKRIVLFPLMLGLMVILGQSMQAQCPPPTGINLSIDTANFLLTIELEGEDSTWVRCEYQVRAAGDINWKKARRAPGPFDVNMLSNLTPSTNYDLRARCACSLVPIDLSPFGPPANFSTPDAPAERLSMDLEHISVFPNPVVSDLNISYQSDMDQQINISVYDLTGRVVVQQVADVEAGINSISVDMSNLQNGTYLLHTMAGYLEHREMLQIIR